MIERTLTYPLTDRDLYRKGILYGRWKRKYGRTQMFLENDEWVATSNHIPSTCPHKIKRIFGFGELFAAVHYMNLGYEVTWEYWGWRWEAASYFKAVQILGDKTADFICQSQPQPPDLFVVDAKNRFFFVEVKLPTDKLSEKQIAFNRSIERHLNKNMPQSRRAPHMPKRHWIELLRLNPEPCNSRLNR
jgi:predicted DNA-binding protein (MmcQ/YjbR family)